MRWYRLSAVLALACFLAYFINAFFSNQKPPSDSPTRLLLKPQEGEENEKLRERYEELRHRSAPDTDWRSLERENARTTVLRLRQQGARQQELFANGAISGIWSERGASNQTGSIRAVDYVPAHDNIYAIANGGTLWRSALGSGKWTLLNQNDRLNPRCISAFVKKEGSVRIVASTGTQLLYSDNEGASFTPSVGIHFPVTWDGNSIAQLVRLNDGSNALYCLTRSFNSSLGSPQFWLYRSTDQGASFAKIYEFAAGYDERISLCNPYNTTDVYAADISSSPGLLKLFAIAGATVTLLNASAPGTGDVPCLLKGTRVNGITTLYLLANNNSLYRSTNLGSSWTFRSNLPEAAWMKMNVSMRNPDWVSYGGVNAFRSTNGGASFTKVNDWVEYYGNASGKLHADIMEIEHFKKSDNTEFTIINTHGGTYTSFDNLVTVSNQSLVSHHATEYYDVLTDTLHPDRIFVGSQDQGMQRTLTGTAPGIQPFEQLVSGDYGQLALTGNGEILWPQYPGGRFTIFTGLDAPAPSYLGSWNMSGTEKPNYGWMLPVAGTFKASANDIWIGGGNITGGGGSFLIKLSMLPKAPFTVTPKQMPYNFRARSSSGTAGITAIEQSFINPGKLFVGTEDGSFFYSSDTGTTWTKTASFGGPGPWYLYGSSILASRKNQNLVWYAGSGYSNPAVYVSTNGGATFTPMSNGLPPTLVNEIVGSPNEDFLFAATEAGPYVYVQMVNKWFPLANENMPVQFFSGVEYIPSQNRVRFSTMGRGVWDFIITNATALPVTLLQFDARYRNGNSYLTWRTGSESFSSHFVVQRSFDGTQFTDIGRVAAAGNSNASRQYQFTDFAPDNRFATDAYYRLLQVDGDGQGQLSKLVTVRLASDGSRFTVMNNPVGPTITFFYRGTRSESTIIRLHDAAGKLVLTKQFSAVAGSNRYEIDGDILKSGIYIASLQNSNETLTLRLLKP